MNKWTRPIPTFVSRKTADGLISCFMVPMWFFLLLGLLLQLNALLWSVIGLYEAVYFVSGIVH